MIRLVQLRFQLLALVVVCVLSHPAAAQTDETEESRPSTIVFPFVYNPAKVNVQTLSHQAQAFLRQNERAIVDPIPSARIAEIVRANPIYAERTQVGREWMQLGIKNYQQLDVPSSVVNLTRGLDGFEEYGHAFVAPTEVAELLMYIALASLESRTADVAFPLNKMEQMIVLDPERVLGEGVYPEQVVQFYRSARSSLEKKIADSGIPNLDLVRRAASISKTDYVVVFSVLSGAKVNSGEPSTSGDVVLGIYDTKNDRVLEPIRMRAPSLDEETLRDVASRLTSRFITCLEAPTDAPVTPLNPSTGTGRWAMQLNFAYMSFFEFPGPPDLVPFGNAGGAVGLSFYVTKEFALRGSVEVLTSIRDKNGAVNESFQTLRGFLGGEVGLTFGPVRFAIGANLESVFLPAVRICVPADYPSRFGECPEFVPSDRFGAFGGLNLRPRVSFGANQSIEIFAGGSASFYVLPLSKGTVNFPASAETGLQYRF